MKCPGCPRNCKRCALIEDHWVEETREGDEGLQAASQETYLLWSPIDQPGCAEREEKP